MTLSPAGAAFDQALLTPEYLANPYVHYARLREEDPVCWSERLDAWIVTRYGDVRGVLLHPKLVVSERAKLFARRLPPEVREEMKPFFAHIAPWLINVDPPDHRRLRRLVDTAFTAKMVEALRPSIAELVDELLERMEGKTRIEFVGEFAYPLPATIIARMLGVPIEARDDFTLWSRQIFDYSGSGKPGPESARVATSAAIHITELLSGLVEERRARPASDLISALVRIEQEGDRLTTQELLSMCGLLMIAGHETTVGLLSNGLLALMRNPGQLEIFRNAPDIAPSAVEEFLRYDTSVQHQTRVAAETFAFGPRRIEKGQRMIGMLGSANRDPAQFPDPDILNLRRTPNPHIAFGFGVHHCLGAPLARLEAQIAFPKVLQRLSGTRLADPNPPYRLNTSNRNPLELWLVR